MAEHNAGTPATPDYARWAETLAAIEHLAANREAITNQLKTLVRQAKELRIPGEAIATAARVNRATIYEWIKP